MIRYAEEKDEQQIRRLIEILEEQETFPADAFHHVFSSQLASEKYLCLVEEEENEIRGMLNLRIEEQLHHVLPVAQIMEFSVDPQYRSMGIGAALFEEAERIARDKGCERIELETSTWRKKAHSFYERMGMKPDHYYFTKDLK